MKKLNVSIMATGLIAETMAATLNKMDEVVCRAVGSRDIKKAEEFANKYGFSAAYGSYEQLVADQQTDIIYIATPHSHHFENAILCLNAGKHVLCEKSFTVNAKQAEQVFDLAKQKNLFIMEAVWTRFMPSIKKIKEIIDSEELGKPQYLNVSFTFPLSKVQRMHDINLAGGALLDLGIYPITLTSALFGSDFECVGTSANLVGGVDFVSSYLMKYKDGKQAILNSCMNGIDSNRAIVCCEKGYIEIERFWCPESFTVHTGKKEEGGTAKIYEMPFDISGYEYEVRAMVEAINQGKTECSEMSHAETMRIMKLMDGMRQQWGLKYPFE